ncbi:MAG: hypothetical protein ACRDH2_08645 [Anaerolineales bacterium]
MDIGMLWYDDTKRDLPAKVARAVEHYKMKYGATPTVCFVHPDMLPNGSERELVAGVQLRAARAVLKNHFWIGVGDGAAKNGSLRSGPDLTGAGGTSRSVNGGARVKNGKRGK